MARARTPNPDELIAALEKKKNGLAVEKKTAEHALTVARAAFPRYNAQGEVIDPGTLRTRRQAAEQAQALGREHEPLAGIDADEAEAHRAVTVNTPRVQALDGAMATLDGEIEDIRASNLEHFARKAHAASLAAAAATARRKQAEDEEETARKDAEGAWGLVRNGRHRRKWEIPPRFPTREDVRGGKAPWPAGRELTEDALAVAWQPGEWGRRVEAAPRLSSSPTGPEPLMERIG